jgi:hypothetical protein
MLIGSVQEFDVKVAADLAGKRPPEVLDKFDVQFPDSVAHLRDSVNHESPAAQIDDGARQRFVHRHISRSESHDALFVSKRFGESLTDGERDVFDRVMRVDVKIARARDFEIEQAVPREQLEHMIEKANAGCDLRIAAPVEVDLHLHVGLASRSSFVCSS